MSGAERLVRARVFYGLAVALGLVIGLFLLWALRALILPAIIGALSAYICVPILDKMSLRRIPRVVGVLILVGAFVATLWLLVSHVKSMIPDEREGLVLRVRVQYKVNEHYEAVRARLPEWLRKEVEPVADGLNRLLALDAEDRRLFGLYFQGHKGYPPLPQEYGAYHRANVSLMKRVRQRQRHRERAQAEEVGQAGAAAREQEGARSQDSVVAYLLRIVSIWIVMPFVFLFLLFDDRRILKHLVSMVPNKYFEVTLTVIHNVDRALGNYLRGVTMQCGLVGLTFFVLLWLFGAPPQAALAIALIAGVANAIPYLGPAIGLVAGFAYALIAENVHPILPYFGPDDLLLGVLLTVVIAQGLDNTVFQPIVLGGAVDLHPLLVIFGVMGGSILFGIVGMLFAVPTVVVVKVVFSTLFRELKAYYII
ncbi:MAG: AI-2E family transporter [Elusimicrobiota bacterium]